MDYDVVFSIQQLWLFRVLLAKVAGLVVRILHSCLQHCYVNHLPSCPNLCCFNDGLSNIFWKILKLSAVR